MNYNQTGIEYVNSYPFVMRGEKNLTTNSKNGLSNTTGHFPAMCQTDLSGQYKLGNVANLPELQCPDNMMFRGIVGANPATPLNLTEGDKKWCFTKADYLMFPQEQKCQVEFSNSISVCSPQNCGAGRDNSYTNGFQCNKLWNNNSKRRFIDTRK